MMKRELLLTRRELVDRVSQWDIAVWDSLRVVLELGLRVNHKDRERDGMLLENWAIAGMQSRVQSRNTNQRSGRSDEMNDSHVDQP